MNTRTKKPSTLCAALGGAGLARTGAMLALALGAAQAGAVTYTVPLQFNITLTPPVCTLTVHNLTADVTTQTQLLTNGPGGNNMMDLTVPPLAVINSPTGIVGAMNSLTTFTSSAAGLHGSSGYAQTRRVTTPPTALATCTAGTPMTAKVKAAGSSAWSASGTSGMTTGAYVVGSPGSGQTPGSTLPIGMLMGIASFAGTTIATGTSGSAGTTISNAEPSVSQTATGSPQAIVLTPAVYAVNTLPLTASSAGTWIYNFDVKLDF